MGGKVRRFRPLHGVSCTAWTMRGSSGCRLVRCSVLWTIRVDVGAGCLVCFEAGNNGCLSINSIKMQPTDHTSMAAIYSKEFSSSSGARYHLVTTYSVIKSLLVETLTSLKMSTKRWVADKGNAGEEVFETCTFDGVSIMEHCSRLINKGRQALMVGAQGDRELHNSSRDQVRWYAPPFDHWKVNVDDVRDLTSGFASCGGAIQDDEGNWLVVVEDCNALRRL
ncbi:hypothetical protein V6N13_072660 [Hibiscus sabdariffa]